jgi:Tfp pilus assembly protein PilX
MKKIKMKKSVSGIILISLLMLLMSCSGEISSSIINPPSWAIGTWTDSTDTVSYTFTTDDMIMDMSSVGMSVDMKEAIAKEDGAKAKENISGDSYKLTISAGNESGTYTFVKTSDTTLNFTIATSGITFGPTELVKK